ncbi:uncharacterized protein LOC5512467 isoform X2 [Nematostella vectensis]|uniref:uncharacterized protein LOC5512467 isoform X2 n=1 Tax=Nematostella vectensis TaxID=45351 RepID=UPI00207779F1|nr:uncharacterized protein LOC5512467 isoform X2 [Nematostella vectensis]
MRALCSLGLCLAVLILGVAAEDRERRDGYSVHEKPPELVVNADTDGVKPHFAHPGYGYGGYYGKRSFIPEDNGRYRRDSPVREKRQWYGWHPFPHTVNVGPHTPPIHVGPHYPPVHIGPHVPAVHIGPHVPVINVPSHVPAIHVRPHVPAVHLGPPIPIVNAGNHFPAVHVTSPPTIYHRPPIVIHQPHIVHPYGSWKRAMIPHEDEEEEEDAEDHEENNENEDTPSDEQEKAEEIQEDEPEDKPTQRKITLRSVIEGKAKRQLFSNANSGPNGDSVIFVHPKSGHSPDQGFADPGLSESLGDLGGKSFGGDNYSPSFSENGNSEMNAGGDSLAGIAGGSLGGADLGGATNSFADNGGMSLGNLGSQGMAGMNEMGGGSMGGASMAGGSMGGLGGLGGFGGAQQGMGESMRSEVPKHTRSEIPMEYHVYV